MVPDVSDRSVIWMESETDLFGNPVASLPRAEAEWSVLNDIALMERVLRAVSTEKFVVVGSGKRVFRRTTCEYVEPVSREWDQSIHQLLRQRWLEIGGTHMVRYDRYTGPARSVLVPRKTRQTAARWTHLHKPEAWKSDNYRDVA